MSGLAGKDGIVFKINGTKYKNVSGKKLSDIVGGLSDTTEYNVELIVTDKAGNRTIKKTVFMLDLSKPDFRAKMTAKGSRDLTLTWTKVKSTQGYDIFFAICSDGPYKLKGTVKGNKTLKWTFKDLKKQTAYKAYVKAWTMKNGKKTYVRTSPAVHAYTSDGTKRRTNAAAIKVTKKKLTLKKNGSYTINAKVIKQKKGRKLMSENHTARLRYLSSDPKVAKVTKDGKIKAKKKGKCSVYVFAHNGVYEKIKVLVR